MKTLPSTADINKLSLVSIFPASRSNLIATANLHNFNKTMIDYLYQFPEERTFFTQDEFIDESETLEQLSVDDDESN